MFISRFISARNIPCIHTDRYVNEWDKQKTFSNFS